MSSNTCLVSAVWLLRIVFILLLESNNVSIFLLMNSRSSSSRVPNRFLDSEPMTLSSPRLLL